jgi:hypothetical protein
MRLRSRPSQPRNRQERAASEGPAERRHAPPRHAKQPRRQGVSLIPELTDLLSARRRSILARPVVSEGAELQLRYRTTARLT